MGEFFLQLFFGFLSLVCAKFAILTFLELIDVIKLGPKEITRRRLEYEKQRFLDDGN